MAVGQASGAEESIVVAEGRFAAEAYQSSAGVGDKLAAGCSGPNIEPVGTSVVAEALAQALGRRFLQEEEGEEGLSWPSSWAVEEGQLEEAEGISGSQQGFAGSEE